MVRIEGEIAINRPLEEVFDFVADERNEPRYNPRMLGAEKVSPEPIGPGTRFRSEFASRGRPVATTEITAYERPRRLASSTHMTMMDVRGTLTFEIRSRRYPHALVMGARTARPLQARRARNRQRRPPPGTGDLREPQAPPRRAGNTSVVTEGIARPEADSAANRQQQSEARGTLSTRTRTNRSRPGRSRCVR